MPYDGHTTIRGVDTSSDPSIIISGTNAVDAVNRKFRGGVSRTRDPFIGLVVEYEDPEIQEVFENGNISGVFGYKKISTTTEATIICAVGNLLLAGKIQSDVVRFRILWDGIDPVWQHSFFVQAENILVWQNGKQIPMIWDGGSAKAISSVDAVAGLLNPAPIPVGNIMTYGHGRIFVATEDNLVYASDHIYSQGFGNNYAVVNFSETTYPSSGDGFGTYSQIGRITGMFTMPRHPDTNGHGEIIVFGEFGAWAINPTKDRTQWTDLDIQQVILIGRGCSSPYSVTAVNNDIFYRCPDKTIASLKSAILDRSQLWTSRSLSREVQRYLDFDSFEPLRFSHGMFADNRLLMSCATRMEVSNGYGNHRFGMGIVALDFDRGNTTTRSDEGFSWDGLWTGPRVTGMVQLQVDRAESNFVFSYDNDKKNRIYRLSKDEEINDRVNQEEKKIRSFYIIGDLFNSNNPVGTPIRSKLSGAAAIISDINREASISMTFRPDRYPLWSDLMCKNFVGSDVTDKDDILDNGVKKYSDVIGSETPDSTEHRNAVSHTINQGWCFQLKIDIEGVLTVNRIISEAAVTELKSLTNVIASRVEEEYSLRERGTNEQDQYFNYTF